MRDVALTLGRLSLAGWVGAATLFVVTGVQEVTSSAFDAPTKSALAALRFPSYYAFGFALVGLSLACGLTLLGDERLGRWRRRTFVGLVAVALGTMLVDHALIFTPLLRMMADATAARPAEFEWYHRASMRINSFDLALCLAAALLLCWPLRTSAAQVPAPLPTRPGD